MQSRMRRAVLLVVVSLLLITVQGFVWGHFTSSTKSETQEMNRADQHPPTEIPGVAGFTLLVAAGVLVALPRPEGTAE